MSYAKAEREFFDPTKQIDWQPVEGYPDGIFERVLSADPESGDYTRLLHFQPGVETHDRLIHDFWEEVFIAEGYLIDKTLGKKFTAGMYACRPPGMEHGPYSTPEGCVTFEVRYRR